MGREESKRKLKRLEDAQRKIAGLFQHNVVGVFLEEEFQRLELLKEKKKNLLQKEETERRLKS
jgi:hypothetical protein